MMNKEVTYEIYDQMIGDWRKVSEPAIGGIKWDGSRGGGEGGV